VDKAALISVPANATDSPFAVEPEIGVKKRPGESEALDASSAGGNYFWTDPTLVGHPDRTKKRKGDAFLFKFNNTFNFICNSSRSSN
jgi:hypothetical protein